MYICICKAITKKKIEEMIENGHDTRCKIAKKCGASTDCGTCTATIRQMCCKEDKAMAGN